MLQSLTNAPRERKRAQSIDVRILQTIFVDEGSSSLPSSPRECTCTHKHRSRTSGTPYPKYEKARPKPLSTYPHLPPIHTYPATELRPDDEKENVFPSDGFENGTKVRRGRSGSRLVDRRRRHGMLCYPEGVRDDLRRTSSLRGVRSSSKSPKLSLPLLDSSLPLAELEPPSWFCGQSVLTSRFSMTSSDQGEPSPGTGTGIVAGLLSQHAQEPQTAKSWETFHIPSIPASPVDSVGSVDVIPRDPRLPPIDYLLHKDMYDDAMIRLHGKLPLEWVAYTHRHGFIATTPTTA
ncbi:hypothetical protein CTheo_3050 [Ceratobasidium theobromae]|uniref:Uncharacterized protein n=1 Tax=Ceratobasidium theobromae TaxID=1582974 RepID=A0A5N5QP12_9AGAM|nr:hypothetical protein CTheo_3050 [Ceratobasidium theobromae]